MNFLSNPLAETICNHDDHRYPLWMKMKSFNDYNYYVQAKNHITTMMSNHRIRARFKMFSRLFPTTICNKLYIIRSVFLLVLLLLLCAITDVNSQPLLQQQHPQYQHYPNHPTDTIQNQQSHQHSADSDGCSIGIRNCLDGVNDHHFHPAQQQSSVNDLSCPKLRKLGQCLDQIKKLCHGDIRYHTLLVLVHKPECSKRFAGRQTSTQRPPIRSMNSAGQSWHQHLSPSGYVKSGHRNQNSEHQYRPMPSSSSSSSFNQQSLVKPDYFQYCLSAAYNFTIGIALHPMKIVDTQDNRLVDHLPFATTTTSQNHPNNEHRYRLRHHHRIKRQDPNDLLANIMFHQQKQTRSQQQKPPAAETLITKSNNPMNQHNQMRLNVTTVQMANELIYKPIHPQTPSLTCMIFGDPHLRTFDSRYQTCNCLGARSLLEHPLFDVQITNKKLQDQFNSTGVTKVIVLVRRFDPCIISNDLIYETDSLAQTSPAATFTDGSVNNYKNLVYITTSMQNQVVTIHLDHIGVRVYISQFYHTKFLNVVIKFRTATSNHMRQDMVLNAINPISLCKSGCHPRELLNIKQELERASIPLEPKLTRDNNKIHQSRLSMADSFSDDDEEDGDDDYDVTGSTHYNDDDYYDEDEDDGDEMLDGNDYATDEDGEEVENTGDVESLNEYGPRHKRRKIRELNEPNSNSNGTAIKKNKNRNRKNRKKNRSTITTTSTTTTTTTTTVRPPSKSLKSRKNRLRSAINNDPGNIANYELSSEDIAVSQVNDNSEDYGMDKIYENKCYEKELIGYHRLACLYDTMIKGTASIYPYNFASTFDEPRLDIQSSNHSLVNNIDDPNRFNNVDQSSSSVAIVRVSIISSVLVLILNICFIVL